MPKKKSAVDEVLDKVRSAVGDSTCNEKELYEELVAEAEGWKMRLEELKQEDEPISDPTN